LIQRAQSGFSLLELLVVFVIVSMVSVLVLQGLGFGLSLYERVRNRGPELTAESMAHDWFRQVNASLLAQNQRGESLVGDRSKFRAKTLNPLIGHVGLPTSIQWQIDQGSLYYSENGQELKVLSLDMDAGFEYLRGDGSWSRFWPVDKDSFNLPKAIRIGFGNASILATVKMRLAPDRLLEESRLDRR
jgi:prepilin-type N-terminal cleavage/methylation domain-containing protein